MWKADIFIICFELTDSFSIKKQVTLLSPLKGKLKESFVFALLKLKLNFFSVAPKFPLIQKLQHSQQSHYQNSTHLFHQMLLHNHYTPTYFYQCFLLY